MVRLDADMGDGRKPVGEFDTMDEAAEAAWDLPEDTPLWFVRIP